ncbi:MAG: hypothetical protein R3330_16595, partial [Saprospiraceae bacterium]|nr:hypothetical protein [Saprospiraceae bacterium]
MSLIRLATFALLAAIFWMPAAPVDASAEIFARADRKCVACHRRKSFQEPPPPGEEWVVHRSVNEFIQEEHQPLSCVSCHSDFEKTPHRDDAELEVDCVSCHRRHPEFVLRDREGESVLATGQPLSTIRTCGVCHDTEYIESSSDHANAGDAQLYHGDRPNAWEAGPGFFGGWEPLSYDYTLTPAGDVD